MTMTDCPPLSARQGDVSLSAEQRETIDKVKQWVETEVAHVLLRTGQVKAEINIKGKDIRANVNAFYQVE